jgi:fluoride ion exporter CrcB/FEX
MSAIAVLILGFIGGGLRYWFSDLGVGTTMMVNMAGSLILGFCLEWMVERRRPEWWQQGVAAGLTGSFTTFSGFVQTGIHLVAQSPVGGLLYLFGNILLGPLLGYVGECVARWCLHIQLLPQQAHKDE